MATVLRDIRSDSAVAPNLKSNNPAGLPGSDATSNLAFTHSRSMQECYVALLTGGHDKTYAIGLTSALTALDARVDYIGSDLVDGPQLHGNPLVRFLNLRGSQREDVGFLQKITRVLVFYARLMKYAAFSRPPIFHILWNSKFELIDRTFLMLYYKFLGKRVVLTAHNVNAGKRDGNDSWLNRITLKLQYRFADHLFVHTARMKEELISDFQAPEGKVSVIPFGINDIFPSTSITSNEAKQRLGVQPNERVVLFFGRIAPYKGLEYLVPAFAEVAAKNPGLRLIIAGKVERGCDSYWEQIRRTIGASVVAERIIERIQFIPDEEVEWYFKAADVLVIPYTHIFQSGVPFLAFSYGLPVIASDVGSLREDIIEGKTGFVCKPRDPSDLAKAIERFYGSELYHQLVSRRLEIREFGRERYSWSKVGEITRGVYSSLLDK